MSADPVRVDPMDARLDFVRIGRVSVDLYGEQIGCRLEAVSSFLKGVGGCPASINAPDYKAGRTEAARKGSLEIHR